MMPTLVAPPARIPWYLRLGLWWARRKLGKDSLPARLLAHAPRAALGAGIFELTTPHASKDLRHRELAVARLVASATAGCAFCLDLNASGHGEAGLSREELDVLVRMDEARWVLLGHREHAAARFAVALSRTPVEVPAELGAELRARFSERAIVMLATAIAQVNYWARFNQALGIPAAGFFPDLACAVPGAHASA